MKGDQRQNKMQQKSLIYVSALLLFSIFAEAQPLDKEPATEVKRCKLSHILPLDGENQRKILFSQALATNPIL